MARRRPARPREEEPERDALRLYALLSVRVPAELALDLRRVAKERGKSVNAAVIEAIRQYIDQS
jgi:predicted HicB family RNase H-like nuclease